ncbi:MAG TPA: LysR family transcriptional regulator, partial [Beijerinckia sp.]|nr:LysR family transcriptional regulator [Beijerinckia sp.]
MTDINIFAHVVETGSLTAAARKLELSLAVVSKRLAKLEAQLGIRLINRTTRRLSLTDEGERFYSRCLRILADLQEAQDEAANPHLPPAGLLRVASTAAFARHQIAPRLASFQERFPDVRVQVIATNREIDLVQNGIDLAIKIGALTASSLVERVLVPDRRVICAAPDYLARFGAPRTPQDLIHHRCVAFGDPPETTWHFERSEGSDPIAVEINASVLSNDGDIAREAALAGSGIVRKSIWHVAKDLEEGRLELLLADYQIATPSIRAAYLLTHTVPAKIRVFLDFLSDQLNAASARQGFAPGDSERRRIREPDSS